MLAVQLRFNMQQIEYLWWAECPSHDEGAELLRVALAAEGLDVQVVSIEVTSEDEAQRLLDEVRSRLVHREYRLPFETDVRWTRLAQRRGFEGRRADAERR